MLFQPSREVGLLQSYTSLLGLDKEIGEYD